MKERLSPKLQMLLDTRHQSIEAELLSFQRGNLRDASHESSEPSAELGLSDKELGAYSINRAARAMASREGFSGLERECHQQLEKRYGPARNAESFYVPSDALRYAPLPASSRAMSSIPGQKGGFLIDTTITSFYDQLQNALIPGVEIITHTTGNVIVTESPVSSDC